MTLAEDFQQPATALQFSEPGIADRAIKASHTPHMQPENVNNDILQEGVAGYSGPSTLPCLQPGDTSQLETDQRFQNHRDSAPNSTLTFSGSQKQSSNTEQCTSGTSSRQHSQEYAPLGKPVPARQRMTGPTSQQISLQDAGM